MLVQGQGLLRLCPGETFHESCAQTAGDLPVAFMKSFDCKIPIQVRAVLADCTVHDTGSEAIPGFFFDVFLVFWRFGVLAFWRSGSGGAERLRDVDVKKLATRGVMPDISNVQKSPFLKTKTENRRRKYQKKGRAS